MIMKATASSMLRKIRTHKHTALVREIVTSEPQVPALAQGERYLDTYRAIDQASRLGIPSRIRVRAMDAMVRLSEGTATQRDQLDSILTEGRHLDEAVLRDMIMTLAAMECTHRATLTNL